MGSIIQLLSNKKSIFLIKDPEVTFFTILHKTHANFYKEDIEHSFNNNPDFGNKVSCNISKYGDMIDNMALKIILPEIQNSFLTKNTKIAWIEKIGFSMINTIEIEINNIVIDKHYGEWLNIWSMLTNNNKNLDRLIGNIPELTMFSDYKSEYTLYIPLYFWFCRNSGLAIPILKLQKSDIYIHLEFYDIEKCLIINPTHFIKCKNNLIILKENELLYQKENKNNIYGLFSYYNILKKELYYRSITSEKFSNCTNNFSKKIIKGFETGFIIKLKKNSKSTLIQQKKIKHIHLKKCIILVSYIFLDIEEKKNFINSDQQIYIIEQLQFTSDIPIKEKNVKVKLIINKPCKLKIWLTQLDYINNINDRFNYTNSYMKDNSISLIVKDQILINNIKRLEIKNHEYFEYIQSTQYFKNRLPIGCGMYSYSLFPEDIMLSGVTNMNHFNNIEIILQMNNIISDQIKAKFRLYALCYGVLGIKNGLCSLLII